ncbi:MAG: ATP-binding protein, partial [Bacteriovoracaceae bacterium]
MAIQNANLHKKVNESEQKLSTIANTIPAPLAYVDHHGRLTFANASFLETFYLFEQKWENEKLSSALPINIHQEIKLRMPQLQAGAEQSFETNFVNLLGERRELEIKLVPKRDLKTKGGWFLIFIQDQTESKKAKLLLQSSKEAAEAANIAKSQFLANMSHEIRTPLGSMMGFAEMIKYYGDSLETTKEWSQKILNCGHHLLEIVNNVLDLAKVEADKIETTIEVFDFKSFMRELEESFPSNKDVALKVSIHPSTPAYLKSDKTLLRQILFNIIGNALKFTERGEVEASVAFQEKDSLLNIKVKDTGPGMSPEQTSKLFKRFSQLDGSNQRKHDGTGLGLVLAQRMARTLGGDVVLAATEPGKGSTFCAKAQVEPAASPLQTITPQCRPQTELVESKALLLKNLNIFIIDDSEDFRFLLSSFFNALGVKIKTFAEGEKAISALREFSVDMIFLDLQMPHMDGYKVKEKLRQSHYDGPILACTANAMKADKERALAAG